MIDLNSIMPVVLAGGLGTRLRQVQPSLPKPMAEVAGRPFLEWVLAFLRANGFSRALLSTGHLSEIIEEHFRTRCDSRMEVRCVREEMPLGTCGGLRNAIENLPPAGIDVWFVLNGDSLVLTSVAPMIATLKEHSQVDGVLLGLSVDDASRFGTLEVNPEGILSGFREKIPGKGPINAGVYLFRDRFIRSYLLETLGPGVKSSLEADFLPSVIRNGAVLRVVPVTAPFIDIGTPESLAEAEGFILSNLHFFQENSPE